MHRRSLIAVRIQTIDTRRHVGDVAHPTPSQTEPASSGRYARDTRIRIDAPLVDQHRECGRKHDLLTDRKSVAARAPCADRLIDDLAAVKNQRPVDIGIA